MTPKEKAKELIDRFTDVDDGEMYVGKAKQCALIAVEYILENLEDHTGEDIQYWIEVRNEINKY